MSDPEGGFDNTRYRSLDLVLVAEIAGRKRLETTRRYSVATERDGEAAMESLRVEY